MSESFSYLPSVTFLQLLTPGSLKQNLAKALRLYVILYAIYSEEKDILTLQLEDVFKFAEWRDKFFLNSKIHSQRDKVPDLHDPNCHCSKTLKQWLLLFYPEQVQQTKWRETFQKEFSLTDGELESLLSWGMILDEDCENKTKLLVSVAKNNKGIKRCPLPEGRLFAVTAKSLENDFKALADKGWLQLKKNSQGEKVFAKVSTFPSTPIGDFDVNKVELGNILNADLATTLNKLGKPINGIQRFSMHIEYVISQDAVDPTEELESQLQKLWNQPDFSPVELTYDSAHYWRTVKLIVYPVYICYYQRALYLCAYGHTPKNKHEIGWYNYRLDRIKSLQESSWENLSIPADLLKLRHQGKLPKPEEIQAAFTDAWGLDFYQPASPILLRFNRDFHDKYIQKTFRHHTFQLINEGEGTELLNNQIKVKQFIKKIVPVAEQEQLLAIVEQYPEDAYYKAIYRVNDNNVIMRLRAWNPNVEVLFPGELREKMIREIEATWKMYTHRNMAE